MREEIDFSILSIQHIIERTPDPNWQMEGVLGSDLYVLGVALQGKATYTINDSSYTVCEGGLILVPPGAVRTARSFPEDPWHFITIGCRIHMDSPGAEAALRLLPQYFPTVPDSIRRKAKELSLIWSSQNRSRSLLAKGLLYEIFHELITLWDQQQVTSPHFDRISKTIAYIHRNYAAPIRQQDLANLCGYSEPHFRRLFSSVVGMSCSQYILHFRIDAAKNLLLSGTATVSEAASLTGFSDVYHFSKMFKRITGYAPSHFKG